MEEPYVVWANSPVCPLGGRRLSGDLAGWRRRKKEREGKWERAMGKKEYKKRLGLHNRKVIEGKRKGEGDGVLRRSGQGGERKK